MNKKILVGVVVLVLIAAVFIGIRFQKANGDPLQQQAYSDQKMGYSIRLPKQWGVFDNQVSTSSSQTWFFSSSTSELATGAKMSVAKFRRGPEVEGFLKYFGEEEFLVSTVETLASQVDNFATTTKDQITINGQRYFHVASTYTGRQSKKQVVQNVYLLLTDNAYYAVGVDAYAEVWPSIKDSVLASINTFTLLQ